MPIRLGQVVAPMWIPAIQAALAAVVVADAEVVGKRNGFPSVLFSDRRELSMSLGLGKRPIVSNSSCSFKV